MVQEDKTLSTEKRFFSFSLKGLLCAALIALLVLIIDFLSYRALVPQLMGQAETHLQAAARRESLAHPVRSRSH